MATLWPADGGLPGQFFPDVAKSQCDLAAYLRLCLAVTTAILCLVFCQVQPNPHNQMLRQRYS